MLLDALHVNGRIENRVNLECPNVGGEQISVLMRMTNRDVFSGHIIALCFPLKRLLSLNDNGHTFLKMLKALGPHFWWLL
jgi:hypothetical protein